MAWRASVSSISFMQGRHSLCSVHRRGILTFTAFSRWRIQKKVYYQESSTTDFKCWSKDIYIRLHIFCLFVLFCKSRCIAAPSFKGDIFLLKKKIKKIIFPFSELGHSHTWPKSHRLRRKWKMMVESQVPGIAYVHAEASRVVTDSNCSLSACLPSPNRPFPHHHHQLCAGLGPRV